MNMNLFAHPSFQRGLDLIMAALVDAQSQDTAMPPESYAQQLQHVAQLRGRPPY